jgi:hypothetical protein
MKRSILLFLFITGFIVTGFSQNSKNEEFKPDGKPLALIFSNFNTKISDGNSISQFQIKRAYLGYEYKFSKNWSGKLVFDVGNPGVGKHQVAAFLKNAYFKYKARKFSAAFGMISTTQFKVSEKIWGYRYLLKSFQDQYKFNASADMGVKVAYKFANFVSADFTVTNGEGYKKIEADSVLRFAFGTTLKPVKNITARVYVDLMGTDTKQQSLATLLAYKGAKFILAAEYNYQKNNKMKDGHDIYGVSLFASYIPSNNVKIFARYDRLQSSTLKGETTAWHLAHDGQYLVAGVEFEPTKGVKLTPNIRNWTSDNSLKPNRLELFINCQVKF